MKPQVDTGPDGGECQHRRPPNSCCRNAVLRLGAMAVSIFYLAVNVIGVVGYACYIVYCSILFESYETHKLYYMSYILLGVIVLAGINVTFDCLLLTGIRKAKQKLVLCWVVWYGIYTTLVSLAWLGGFILWIYLVATMPSSGTALAVFFACVHCLLGLVILPLMWLCFACVSSYLATLTPSDDRRLISKLVRQNTRFGLVNLPPHEGE